MAELCPEKAAGRQAVYCFDCNPAGGIPGASIGRAAAAAGLRVTESARCCRAFCIIRAVGQGHCSRASEGGRGCCGLAARSRRGFGKSGNRRQEGKEL